MDLIFLGTGSAYPLKTRGASCTMLRNSGEIWMFDCGEGSQVQIQRAPSVTPNRVKKIFITHLHGDHLYGLPGFMSSIRHEGIRKEQNPTLEIYGPTGLRTYLRTCLHLSQSDLGCRYIVHELVPLPKQYSKRWEDLGINGNDLHRSENPGGLNITADDDETWNLINDAQFTVKAGWLEHRVPCFGYVIQESDAPGKLDAALLKAKGVKPGALYSEIKKGMSITSPTGEVIRPEDVLGPPKIGRKIGILGDSCDSNAMTSLCSNCDVIVHETTLENELWESCIEKGHSTPEMAGQFAKNANAKRLVITHFSQRYKSANEEIKEGDYCVDKLLGQAKAVFGDDVVAAEDFLVLPIPVKKS